MKRTTVFLTEEQIKWLRRAAKHKGLDVAQLIRIYVSAGLDKEKTQ
jgi:hypothetical protein